VTRSLLDDAFAHHVWATLRVMDACEELSPEQLDATAEGTYGSIIETLRHVVAADNNYLFVTTGGRVPLIDDEQWDRMDLPELRDRMAAHGEEWSSVLATNPDPEQVLERHRDDGSETHAPFGLRLAQAVHHGTDHRSHIATILTTLGVEPPLIDLWDFGVENGRVVEIPPTA
jgi:uncharacterized damage-inducible protein DinB